MNKIKVQTDEKQIEDYIQQNKNSLHQCDKCKGVFPTNYGLDIHKNRWCVYNNLCHQCGKILKNKKGLNIHINIWCGKTPQSKNAIELWSGLSVEEKLQTIQYNKKRKGQLIDKKLKCKIETEIISKMDSIYIDNKRIDTVRTFVYVGSIVSYDGNNDIDINKRLLLAKQQLNRLRNMIRNRNIYLDLRIRLISIYIMSILFWNCVGWLISPKMCRKIERFANLCASYLYNTEYEQEQTTNRLGKVFMLFLLKQRWNWLRICLMADEQRDIYKTMIK